MSSEAPSLLHLLGLWKQLRETGGRAGGKEASNIKNHVQYGFFFLLLFLDYSTPWSVLYVITM